MTVDLKQFKNIDSCRYYLVLKEKSRFYDLIRLTQNTIVNIFCRVIIYDAINLKLMLMKIKFYCNVMEISNINHNIMELKMSVIGGLRVSEI